MKKQILLASLLSVGILSVTQSAQAFIPGPHLNGVKVEAKTEKKVDADIQAKVIMHKDENGTLRGVTIEITDADVADGILNFMDEKGVYYSEDDKDDTGGDTGDTGGTTDDGGDKGPGKVTPGDATVTPLTPEECKNDADCQGNADTGYWKETKKSSYTDDNPVGDGTDDDTDDETGGWKKGTK